MDQGNVGNAARQLIGAMSFRHFAIVTLVIALALGAIGYAIGVSSRDTQLTAEQRKEVETVIRQALEESAEETEPPTETAALSEDRRGEIETLIRDHLLANPDIITDSIDAMREREIEAELAAAGEALVTNAEMIFDSERQVVIGNPDGDVTLVEFFDYNCPFCSGAVADIQQLIEEDPGLRVVLKEFPVLEEGSVEAARVAVAIRMAAIDKYEAFHVALMAEPGSVNGDRAMAIAEEVGIDPETLEPLLDSEEVIDTINEVYEIADIVRINGTPAFVTSKEVMEGAVGIETLREKIAEARLN